MVQGDRHCRTTIMRWEMQVLVIRVVNNSEAAAVNLNRKVPHSDQSRKTR